MNPNNPAWTVKLGYIICQLQESGAPERLIKEVEDELIHAIQSIRFVRRCYNLPSQHLAEHE